VSSALLHLPRLGCGRPTPLTGYQHARSRRRRHRDHSRVLDHIGHATVRAS
jgi:hypothetical protein